MDKEQQLLGVAKDILKCEERLEQLKFEFATLLNGSASSVPRASKKKLAKSVADRVSVKRTRRRKDDTPARAEILKLLKKKPLTTSQIIKEVGIGYTRATGILDSLKRGGHISKTRMARKTKNNKTLESNVWVLN